MAIEINPFVVSGQIPANLFCDREKETKEIIRLLSNQQNVVLVSARRMGKTKLIDHVFEQAEMADDYIMISVDILQTGSLKELVFILGNAVFNKLARRSDKLMRAFTTTLHSLNASFGYDPIKGTPTFNIRLGDITKPEYTLEEIFTFLNQADKRCIVVIDEFQQIVSYPEKNVEALLRSHVQKCANANFVFSGSSRRTMSELFGSSTRPFFNSASMVYLDSIPLEDYSDFVRFHFKEHGKGIVQDAILQAYKAFRGVTLYNQQAMNLAFSLTRKGEDCTVEVMSSVIENLVSQNDKKERELLQFLTEPQKAVLYAVMEEEPVKAITSGAFTNKHRLTSPSSTQAAMKRLLELDFVTVSEGKYSISDPMLDLWLKSYNKNA